MEDINKFIDMNISNNKPIENVAADDTKENKSRKTDDIKLYYKNYRKNNEEKIKEYYKQYCIKNPPSLKVSCSECEKIISKSSLSRHRNTKRCKNIKDKKLLEAVSISNQELN